MPFGPSDLPWWGWLLCALGAALLTAIMAIGLLAKEENDWGGLVILVIAALATVISFLVGIIRFVKWAWVG